MAAFDVILGAGWKEEGGEWEEGHGKREGGGELALFDEFARGME